MDNIIKVTGIAYYSLKKTFTNSKIYIIMILSFMYGKRLIFSRL